MVPFIFSHDQAGFFMCFGPRLLVHIMYYMYTMELESAKVVCVGYIL